MQYPLTVAAHRLGISLFTLRQWCEKAGIDLEQQRSLADPRQKWLTEEQLQQLALDHGRLLDQEKPEPEPIPANAYRLLVEQVAQVVQQAEQIHTDHARLREQQQEFERFRQDTATQLDTIRQEQARSGEAEQGMAQTLGSHGERLSGFDVTLTELRVRYQQVSSTLEDHQRQTRAQFQETDASLHSTAERLEEIITATRQQGQQLAQLATRIYKQDQEIAQWASQLQSLQKEMQAQAEQTKQAQARLQEWAEQAEQHLRAEFQETLTALQQQTQGALEQQARELTAAIQSAEQDEARDVAELTAAQGQQGQQLNEVLRQATQAITSAEAANVAAQGSQSRLDPMEQRLADLEKRLQVERVARESLTQRLEALQQPGQPQERKKPRGRPKQAETATEA